MESYIKIICQPYSGSTLLAFLLSNHPEIATVGELVGKSYYDGYRCSCGYLFIECPFWLEVADRMRAKGIRVDIRNMDIAIPSPTNITRLDLLHHHYFPLKLFDDILNFFFIFDKKRNEKIERIVKRNIILANTITEIYRKTHFFDTSQDIFRVKYLIRKLGSKIKFIYLTRDGRGVFNSIIKNKNFSDRRAIDNWIWSDRMNNRVLNNYCSSDQILHLSYEDLCRNTQDAFKYVFKFIGVSNETISVFFTTKDQHIIGNRMRKNFSGEILFDQKWKSELRADQLAFFDKIAGKRNRRLGYA